MPRNAFAGLSNNDMNAQELADKFTAKIAVAAVEKNTQTKLAADNVEKRTALQEGYGTAGAAFLGGTEASYG